MPGLIAGAPRYGRAGAGTAFDTRLGATGAVGDATCFCAVAESRVTEAGLARAIDEPALTSIAVTSDVTIAVRAILDLLFMTLPWPGTEQTTARNTGGTRVPIQRGWGSEQSQLPCPGTTTALAVVSAEEASLCSWRRTYCFSRGAPRASGADSDRPGYLRFRCRDVRSFWPSRSSIGQNTRRHPLQHGERL
jgi:hypothetical protein